MAFLSDIFKKDPDKSFIVNYAPIFVNLNFFEKNLIMQKSKVIECNKGDMIYKQFGPPDGFYCVITGRIRIFAGFGTREETLEYLNCGKYFGMISVLTGDLHSVSAEAVNDSKILKINRDDFQAILNKIPKLAIDLSRTLSRRLRKRDIKDKRIFESNIITIFSANRQTGQTVYAANLALSLKKETGRDVVLVDVCDKAQDVAETLGLPEQCGARFIKLEPPLPAEETIKEAVFTDQPLGISVLNVRHEAERTDYAASLNALLTLLTGSYHYIIVDLSVPLDTAVWQVLNQSDMIHVITDYNADSLRSTKAMISDLFAKVKYPQEKIRVILNASKGSQPIAYSQVYNILEHKVYASLADFSQQPDAGSLTGRVVIDNPYFEYSKTIRRIAREIGDVRVGLALGGGAAFGLAHIGIIKVLERENIPIDMVVGSSMGALIGVLWAVGFNGKQIESIMMEYNNNKKKAFRLLADLCFPKVSLAKGERIRSFLETYIADKTFQDVKFPFKVVGCNLSKRQEFVFSSGDLIEAVAASIAIPGVFPPVNINGDNIIDGGIIEPVPIGTLVKAGIKKIIAVNVLPSAENIAQGYEFARNRREEEKKLAQEGGLFTNMAHGLRAHFNKTLSPNILDIIVNSIQTMEYVIAESDCQKADVVINPIVPSVEWFEFHKVELLIKKGEEELENALSNIKRLVNE